MTTSPDFGLPLVGQLQAQPEVTHNEALLLLQLLLSGVIDRAVDAPPGSPADGDTYIIGAAPTGAWSGQSNKLAIRYGGVWRFVPDVDSAGSNIAIAARHEGWTVWVRDENLPYVWDGAAWTALLGPGPVGIASGGTGATTVQGSRAALGIDAVRTISATGPTALDANDRIVLVDATTNNVTVTLPAANAYGASITRELTVKRIDATGNTATVQRAGADTIDGATNFTLAGAAAKHLASNAAAAWHSV